MTNATNQPQWFAECILWYHIFRRDEWQLKIGDATLFANGDAILGTTMYRRGDPIDCQFGGQQVHRDAGSDMLELVDPVGEKTWMNYDGCYFLGINLSSSWFRIVPVDRPTQV